MRLPRPRALCVRLAGLAAAVALAAPCLSAVPAAAQDDPAPEWERRLARIERSLQRLDPADAKARAGVAGQLAGLRIDMVEWLVAHGPGAASEAGLEPHGPSGQVEDLAAEIGRLRAAISRIRAMDDGQPGAFYLGRVDVVVAAAAPLARTTEPAPVGGDVITARELEAHDRSSLALALAPGVTFSRGGSRNETAVFVRGFDLNQVPLFIDGIPIYTPYDGHVDLDRFTTADMAEVRVTKGFSSILYGPNALGGAINIVSRRPAGRLDGLAAASYGSGASTRASLDVGSSMPAWYIQGAASLLRADTFPLAGGFTPVKTQPAGDRRNADRQDARVSVKVGWMPGVTARCRFR